MNNEEGNPINKDHMTAINGEHVSSVHVSTFIPSISMKNV